MFFLFCFDHSDQTAAIKMYEKPGLTKSADVCTSPLTIVMIKAIIKITSFFLFIWQPAVLVKKIMHLTNFSGQFQIYVKLTNIHKRLSLQTRNSNI